MKLFSIVITNLVLLITLVKSADAHVVVRPDEVGIGTYQTFTVSVPVEKDTATIVVRLLIPEGLESVRPNVKPGWDLEIVRENNEPESRVVELVWTNGSIPKDQRDEFHFSARTPTEPTTLRWSAYQTYADGSIVAWDLDETDQRPKTQEGESDFSVLGPVSTTQVIDDLADETQKKPRVNPDIWTAAALAMSLGALGMQFLRKT